MIRRLFITLLAALTLNDAWCGEIGRLFFTPQQRMQIEREHAADIARQETAASHLRLNGIVQHDGKRTAWINSSMQYSGTDGKLPPDTHLIARPGSRRPIMIKVGQSVDIEHAP